MKRTLFLGLAAALVFSAPLHAEECGPLMIAAQIDLVPAQNRHAEYVPVEIAGAKKLLLLDTGSSQTMLSERVATELKLPSRQTGRRVYSVTGRYSDTAVSAMTVLGVMKNKIEFMLTPDDTDVDPQEAGILGADILSLLDVSADFGTHKLDLISQNHCEGRMLYWPTRPVAIIKFKKLSSGQVIIPVLLDGKSVNAILDTGASASTLRRPAAEADFGISVGSPDTRAVGILNGEKGNTVWRHTFKTLTFEGVTVGSPSIVIIEDRSTKHFEDKELGSMISRPNEQVEPDMILGMDVLKHLHVYIAYKEQKVYITVSAAEAPPPKQP